MDVAWSNTPQSLTQNYKNMSQPTPKRSRFTPVESTPHVTSTRRLTQYLVHAEKEYQLSLCMCRACGVDGVTAFESVGLGTADMELQLSNRRREMEEYTYSGELILMTDRGARWSTAKIATHLLRDAQAIQKKRRHLYHKLTSVLQLK